MFLILGVIGVSPMGMTLRYIYIFLLGDGLKLLFTTLVVIQATTAI